MIQYSADGEIAIYDGYKFRRDPNTGYYLCTKKTDAGKRERLHVYVWRKANGSIPDGYHVHHVDGNKRNNEINNLAAMPGISHVSFHGKELWDKNHERMSQIVRDNAVPAAKEWHGSPEGKAWHADHMRETMARLEKKEYACQRCGRTFKALPVGMEKKFCSNACKTAARRESGIDNEERQCQYCGKKFTTNRYSGATSCSGRCAALLRWDKRHKASRA